MIVRYSVERGGSSAVRSIAWPLRCCASLPHTLCMEAGRQAVRRIDRTKANRDKLIAAARRSFAAKDFAAASMDDITADAGLTRGALYHGLGGKTGLLAAVVEQIDREMAERAHRVAKAQDSTWEGLLAEAAAYIEMALEPEIRRIVLLDGPAILGDPSLWPSQNACLAQTREAVASLVACGIMKPVDVEVAARLLSGAAMTAALWLATSDTPDEHLARAVATYREMASGFLAKTQAGSKSRSARLK